VLGVTLNNAYAIEPGKRQVVPPAGNATSPINSSVSQGRKTPQMTASVQASGMTRATAVRRDKASLPASTAPHLTSLAAANLSGLSPNQSGVSAGNTLRENANSSSVGPQTQQSSNRSTKVAIPSVRTPMNASAPIQNVSNLRVPQAGILNESRSAGASVQPSP